MSNRLESTNKKQAVISKKPTPPGTEGTLRDLAFDNSIQANIISTVSSGKIIVANSAACKLLDYSKKELLTKSRAAIFDINQSGFKKMMRKRTAEGYSSALVTAIKKSGKLLPCEVTSTIFMDEAGVEKSITTIVDMSQNILTQKNIDIRKEEIVADNISLAISKQKNIDIKNEKIVAGNIVLAISKQKKIDTKKEKIVADNIILAISKQKNIDNKNERIVAGNILIAKSKQKKIDTIKEKIVADNILLAQAKSDAGMAENNKWIKYIAVTSYDIMWDWNVATGEVYVGDSIEEVFGYKLQNNTANFKDFVNCLLPEEKKIVEKKLMKTLSSKSRSWNDSYMFKRRDGSVAFTNSRASIVRDEEGKATRLIGATQDVSRLRELEKELKLQIINKEEISEIFTTAFKLSFDGIWNWNLLTNEFLLGVGFEELFGYQVKNNKGNITADWSNHLHPDDKNSVERGLQEAIVSSASQWERAYRFVKADGSVAKVLNRATIIRHANGKAHHIIGVMQDISKQEILEERLEQEIKLKEKQIAEATADARETERCDIGKELHDNVNQLLGASRLYSNMAKAGGVNKEMFLSRSSQYTLDAIEEIRKLTRGLTTDIIKNVGLCVAIMNITRDTMEVNQVKISSRLESFIEQSVGDKFKLNVFRIVQEELNNILKHAHATDVIISLSQNKKFIRLTISDNGVGFDTRKKQTGIGIENIKSRAAAYNGIADFASQPGKGCVLNVTFPFARVLLNKGQPASV